MLMPALSKARQKARTISCLNNQKQLSLYLQMYSLDHEESLPFDPARHTFKFFYQACWLTYKMQSYFPDLLSYGNNCMWRCPSDSTFWNTQKYQLSTYKMTSYAGPVTMYLQGGNRVVQVFVDGKMQSTQYNWSARYVPSMLPILFDSNFCGNRNTTDYNPAMHNYGGNLVYADGHAAWLRMTETSGPDRRDVIFIAQ